MYDSPTHERAGHTNAGHKFLRKIYEFEEFREMGGVLRREQGIHCVSFYNNAENTWESRGGHG